MNYTNKINFFFKTLIYILLILAFYSCFLIGFSVDEYFHHINGLVRFKYLFSLGDFDKFNFRNNQYYPGLYDTLVYSISHIFLIINKNIFINYLPQLMHVINYVFSLFGIIGLYIFTKKIFNNNVAVISVLLSLLNPFFFGHLSMNPKDIIIFSSLIWFCYFFYKYSMDDKKILRNIFFASIFVGIGCGVRLTFLVIIFPVVIFGLIQLLYKYKSNKINLIKRISIHFVIAFFIITFLVVLCWPHMIVEIQNGNFFNFLDQIVKNTVNWNQGPKLGLINGSIYEVFNTPFSYFLSVLTYRIPFYLTILIIISYYLFLTGKFNLETGDQKLKKNFLLINSIAYFPLLLAVALKVNIYDNIRLFIFVLPFFSILAALSLNNLIINFSKNYKSKVIIIILIPLFLLSFYRFLILTPYQYSYVNYSYLNLKNSYGKFEHDYWAISYKELVQKIKNNYTPEEISKFRITDCSGIDMTLVYFLNKELNIKKTLTGRDSKRNATHIIMNNRGYMNLFNNPAVDHMIRDDESYLNKDFEKIINSPNVKTTCFDFKGFKGKDEVVVSRGGLTLSVFRKLENND